MHSIKTKTDFVNFIYSLRNELNTKPDEWENHTLDSYLEALAACTEDMDGYYINMGMPIPENINWSVFADILKAASIYE